VIWRIPLIRHTRRIRRTRVTATSDAMQGEQYRRRANNLRMGLILASIAAAFFLGFLLRRYYQ